MNWTALGVVGSLVVSLLGAAFGFVQANRATKSASTTKTIELGVKDLIDQYQEANKNLHDEVEQCKGECSELRIELAQVRKELDAVLTHNDTLEAEVIRLKRKTGEIK